MEKPAFTKVNLSDVRAIMVVTGQVPVLKYQMSGACGRLWSYPVVPGIKCHFFLRI
jgi:hypothetical protein